MLAAVTATPSMAAAGKCGLERDCPDGRGGDVAEGLVQRQPEGSAVRPVGEFGQGLRQSFACGGEGNVVEVDGALVRS